MKLHCRCILPRGAAEPHAHIHGFSSETPRDAALDPRHPPVARIVSRHHAGDSVSVDCSRFFRPRSQKITSWHLSRAGNAGYQQTVHFKSFETIEACLKSGGRLPKNLDAQESHFDPSKPAHAGDEGVLFGPLIKVIDGDTLIVKVQGAALRIRLVGIDAPEADQPFGDIARIELAGLIGDAAVRAGVRGGRYVRPPHRASLDR